MISNALIISLQCHTSHLRGKAEYAFVDLFFNMKFVQQYTVKYTIKIKEKSKI